MTSAKLRRNGKPLVFVFIGLAIVGVVIWPYMRRIRTADELLILKGQLAKPEQFVGTTDADFFVIELKSPTVSEETVRKSGIGPTTIIADGESRTWVLKLSRAFGAQKTQSELRIVFRRGKLAELRLPRPVGRFVSKEALAQYCRILGNSTIDLKRKRSVLDPRAGVAINALEFPDASDSLAMFGEPNSRSEVGMNQVNSYVQQIEKPDGKGVKSFKINLVFHRFTGTFKYGVVALAGYGIIFDEAGVSIRR
ncbi:hypothetical protein DB347_18020 [Opitutaceae bacterium EW11]|nr:hypothetical protein DB347_18020 [Opitutaceae bacterium EW11]